jgi:hypothetical protein
MEAAMSEWLDLELSHHLAPIDAPGELWARVQGAGRPDRRRSSIFAVPVAAVATLVLAGALYFIARGAPAPAPYRATNPVVGCVHCHT